MEWSCEGENWHLWSCNVCYIVLWQMLLLRGLEKVEFYNIVHFLYNLVANGPEGLLYGLGKVKCHNMVHFLIQLFIINVPIIVTAVLKRLISAIGCIF